MINRVASVSKTAMGKLGNGRECKGKRGARLITRNTIEEKILNLQQRKREIISATLDGEEQLTEALTIEELRELLQ